MTIAAAIKNIEHDIATPVDAKEKYCQLHKDWQSCDFHTELINGCLDCQNYISQS